MPDAPTIRIAPDVKLGQNVKIYAFVNLYGCEIGDDSRVGTFVEIQKGARIGRRVKVSQTCTRQGIGGAMEGDAVGVSPEGALLVRDDDGQVHTVWAGDVTALRPA